MPHAARQLPSWLTSNVGQRRMNQLYVLALLVLGVVAHGAEYIKRANGVVLVGWNAGEGSYERQVIGADLATFEVVLGLYAKDRNRVYLEGRPLETADPATFQRIGRRYWRDRTHVFLHTWILPGADPRTFRMLTTEREWGMDAKEVYFGTTAIKVADIGSFQVIREHWAKDAKHYYTDVGLTTHYKVDCDYSSFTILSARYAKDKFRAYWGGHVIEGAELTTFEAVGQFRAKDSKWYYIGSKRQRSVEKELELRLR
jgi:hypothetical protein